MKRHIVAWQCPDDTGCGKEFDEPGRDCDEMAVCPNCGSQYVLPLRSDEPPPKARRRRKKHAGQMSMDL